MSVNAILTGQQKSYTKAEEDAFLAARANKKDFVYIESSSTATNAYRVGEYFYWTDGSIYRAQENIASGATLVASGNCNRVGSNGALNSAQNSKANNIDLAYTNSWGSTATNAYKIGNYFYWNGQLYKAISDIAYGTTLTIGSNCELVNNGGLNEPLMRGSWSCILQVPKKENNVDGSAYIDFIPGYQGILISLGNVSSVYGMWLVLTTPTTVNLTPILSPPTPGLTYTKSALRVTFTNPSAVNVRLYYCSLTPTFTQLPEIN